MRAKEQSEFEAATVRSHSSSAPYECYVSAGWSVANVLAAFCLVHRAGPAGHIGLSFFRSGFLAIRLGDLRTGVSAQGDSKENLASMNAAIAALEKGMGAKALMQMSKQSLVQLTKVSPARYAFCRRVCSGVTRFVRLFGLDQCT